MLVASSWPFQLLRWLQLDNFCRLSTATVAAAPIGAGGVAIALRGGCRSCCRPARLIPQMDLHVRLQRRLGVQLLLADLALEGEVAGVRPGVYLQVIALSKALATNIAPAIQKTIRKLLKMKGI